MNSEEAKFILSSLRPDSSDSDDPIFAEALAVAGSDPALKAWWENSQQEDRIIEEQLGKIEPPSELKSTILAGLHVSSKKPATKRRNILFLAAAAAVGVVATSRSFLSFPETDPASDPTTAFREAMIQEIKSLETFDYVSEDSAAVQNWLNSRSPAEKIEFPDNVKSFKTAGCKLLDWHGSSASLICFHLNPEDPGPTVHLVVVDTELFPELPLENPEIKTHQAWASAVWKNGGKTYLLATVHEASDLKAWAGTRS